MKNNSLLIKALCCCFMFCSFLAFGQNDLCDDALAISCGDTVAGSTSGATFDDVGFCGTSNTAPGVWYKFQGDGSTVTVSTCNQASYDTKISVFSGACGSLSCVGGNDDGSGCSGFTSEFEFDSVAGTDYFILVHGFGSATGSFDLSLSCETPPEPPANDLCADAIGLECGSVENGNTELATEIGEPGFCDTSVSAPGVWYKFEGNGADVAVTTCSPNTDYDTKLYVYEGECGSLVCVGGDDDDFDCPDSIRHSLVEFNSVVGTSYYIYVAGFGSNTGNFELSLDCKVQVELDESCTTVYTSYEPQRCADLNATASFGAPPYSFSWSSGEATASINVCPLVTTTYEVTVTDSKGDTATAESTVVVVDNTCGNKFEKVQICHVTGDGTTQTICVAESAVQAHLDHGDYLGDCGNTFTCDTAPDCASITSPEDGATEVSYQADISWTAGLGLNDGYLVSVGTTPGGTDVADNVDVGDATSYDPGDLDFLTTYYVSVTAYNGNGSAQGCSEISFMTEDVPIPENDLCEDALPIACGDVVNGDTTFATGDGTLPFCGTSSTESPGVWYKFTGTGEYISALASTENSDFDTKLFVFTGQCNALTCIGGNDDGGPGLTSEVEFDTVENESYFIYVTGFFSSFSGPRFGEYELSLSCIEPPAPEPEAFNEIDCNAGAAEYSYCYGNNDTTGWVFASNNGTALTLTFTAGTIEGFYDYVRVYDGTDSSGTLLFESSASFGTIDLAGETATSSGDSLYVEVDSDVSVSCQSGSRATWSIEADCGAVRLANPDSLDWTMYPNPTKGDVQLDLTDLNVQAAQIEVADFSGKKLRNIAVTNADRSRVNMNLQGLTSGVYFVKVITKQGVSIKQLIVQ